jgi:hypothetical protein
MPYKIRFGFANSYECTRLDETRKYWCCEIFLRVEASRTSFLLEIIY